MEHLRFIYGLLEGRTVHLRPVGRPHGSSYGSFTVYQKAVRFNYGPLEGYTVHLWSVGRLYGSFTIYRKAVRFIYGLSEGCMVHLRPVGRPYGSSTACRKAVRFTLRTVSRTHGQFGAPFIRQPRRHLRRDFLCIFFYIFLFYESNYGGYI